MSLATAQLNVEFCEGSLLAISLVIDVWLNKLRHTFSFHVPRSVPEGARGPQPAS